MDEKKLEELRRVKGEVKAEIQEIERWILDSPNRPFYFRIADSPTFSFRRFTNVEKDAIEKRLPKTEEEAVEQSKNPVKNEEARRLVIDDLIKCSLDKISREIWDKMDYRDLIGLWAELLMVSRKREEAVEKFRPDQ